MNIAGENGKIIVFVNENALVPSLIQVSHAVVATVVIAGIGYIKLAHEFGQVGFWGFEKQMEMIGHKHVTVQLDRVDIYRLDEDLKKPFPIFIVFEYVLPFIPPTRDVVHCIWVLNAKRASHGRR